ncbi:MAG: hypothetical protein J6386_20855 [Candidatus Synoicihabitans palmerolidicus]|nr:hypothetical protein [Candidatus Synoicihabitans palmerolidicus]
MVAGILTADGYEVVAAPTAATAIIALKRLGKAVHLVVADPTEPSGDVTRLIRKLHRHQAGLRVLCTPNRKTQSLNWLDSTRQRILPKSFALSTLLQDVRELLDQEA